MTDEFTYAVIGLAMEAHRELGPGLDDKFYHELLSKKLAAAGLAHLSRPRRELIHRGVVADVFEPDIVFPEKLVLELKCLTGGFDGEHFLQLICYLKFWNIGVGLLFDFGKESLAYRRIEFSETPLEPLNSDSMLAGGPTPTAVHNTAAQVCAATNRVLAEHGLGYRDTTYGGLLLAELRASGMNCASNAIAEVRSGEIVLGQTPCPCLLVNEQLAVKVLALRRSITAADLAILRTYMRLLAAPSGLILNFNRTTLEHRWVGSSRQST